ncbi:hypothetical protein HDU87_004612 [Geranomyces variabilis]|uniref:Histone H1 n=1 Tax=Geranomyces variabilis TaxID=109894 RepID=A0AAD5TKD1_9FUNG|nr:hypothetical protein HDU87_004612 [Geranomyces variabilis]
MPATKSAASKKAAQHPAYKEMVTVAITELKDRTGSSRQQIKKYIESNYKGLNDTAGKLINTAIKNGVASGDFVQPKGPSGPVKIHKGGHAAPAEKPTTKKTVAKKATTTKKPASAAKKTTTKAKVTTARKTAAKKAAPAKKTSTAAKSPKKAVKKRTTPKLAPTPAVKKDTAQANKARAARAAKRA